jgi:hypothetical protein
VEQGANFPHPQATVEQGANFFRAFIQQATVEQGANKTASSQAIHRQGANFPQAALRWGANLPGQEESEGVEFFWLDNIQICKIFLVRHLIQDQNVFQWLEVGVCTRGQL